MTAAARKRRAPTLTLNLKPEELRVLLELTTLTLSLSGWADNVVLQGAHDKLAKLRQRARRGGS